MREFVETRIRVNGKEVFQEPVRIGPGKIIETEDYGYVPNYPSPLDKQEPNFLVPLEGNENKSY